MSELKKVLNYLSDKEKKYDYYKNKNTKINLNKNLKKKDTSVSCLKMFELINKNN
tara:strand:- start:296 stop:460 length:165 start_codon:yes stop_codon:yes gene_type:complete